MKPIHSKDLMLLQDLHKDLNSSQKQAVQTFDGPLLILAGAGSGKTRVLVYRIATLVLEQKASLNNILAVTFTNKAAKEMKERLNDLFSTCGKYYGHAPWVGTFHSVCAQILRKNIHLLEGRTQVNIYDQGEQLSLIKKVLRDLNLDPKIKDPKGLRSQINLCKRMGLGPHELHRLSYTSYDKTFENIYQVYEKALKKASAFDFESLLLESYRLMIKHPDFLNALHNQFQYICVDEYQDTNHIQYLLIKKLAEKNKNICVVGDEDQSIYGWRGADMNNIMDFEKDFPSCKTFFLEENYRSTQNIVKGANGLIANNKIRKGKTLISQNPIGEKIFIRETFNDYEEGRFVAESIRSFCANEGNTWGHFTALYRTNAQSRMLEDHLRALRIPYKIVGGLRFYERKEIKEILSYLKLLLNHEDDVSFLNIINSPRRGIGKVALSRLQNESLKQGSSLYKTLKNQFQRKVFKGKNFFTIRSFIQCFEDLKLKKNQISLSELYSLLLDKSTYIKRLEAEKSIEAKSRIENLWELGNVIEQKENSNRRRWVFSLRSFFRGDEPPLSRR